MSAAKILIVDDSQTVIEYLTGILQGSDYEILTAINGKEGLKIVENNTVDLILSDKQMPVMDGVDFCKAVKGAERTQNIYFILLSTSDTSESKTAALNIGADDYLSKTITSEELIARVKAGLRIRQLMEQLKEANLSLFQSEKLASIGQLAAGVAHEINNPISFITSNIKTLKDYSADLLMYQSELEKIARQYCPDEKSSVEQLRQKLDIDYITEDINNLIDESLEGSRRVKKIVLDLKDFARIDHDEKQDSSIEELIESTLNIIRNDLKYKADIIKKYADESLIVNCNSQEINQVLVNLLINASQAIKDRGQITIKTWQDTQYANITISDTGCGIPQENITKLFDPFFTTKPVGQEQG